MRRAALAAALCCGLAGGCLCGNIPDVSANYDAGVATTGGSVAGTSASGGRTSTGTIGGETSTGSTGGGSSSGVSSASSTTGGPGTTGAAIGTTGSGGTTGSSGPAGTTGTTGTAGGSSGSGSSSGGTSGGTGSSGGLPTWTACRAGQPLAIDGNPAPWSAVPGFFMPYTDALIGPSYPVAPTSDAQLSATVKTAWDSTRLYVFVEVTDPTVVDFASAQYLYENDSTELYVDGTDSRLPAYDAGDYQLTVNAFGQGAGFQGNPKTIDAGLWAFAAALTDAGYDVEYGVPWALILGNDGGAIGFDVAVNGNDGGGPWRESQLMWSGDGGAFFDPQQFGQLRLDHGLCGADAG
ncbi:MAG TPA: sugar-binding protein [Myxococcales bacterium]|nr:sugar-binding protein [Myxococcales bacterium]